MPAGPGTILHPVDDAVRTGTEIENLNFRVLVLVPHRLRLVRTEIHAHATADVKYPSGSAGVAGPSVLGVTEVFGLLIDPVSIRYLFVIPNFELNIFMDRYLWISDFTLSGARRGPRGR